MSKSLSLPGDIEDLELPKPAWSSASESPSSQPTSDIEQEFHKHLVKLDRAKGSNLASLFQDCLKYQNETQVLRHNLVQLQIMLQDQMSVWAETRESLAIKIKQLSPSSKNYTSVMRQYAELSSVTTKMVLDITKVVKDLKKEIRLTEMGDQYHFHVSVVLQFMTALTALLFKELHSRPELNTIVSGMKDLARMFQVREAQDITQDVEA